MALFNCNFYSKSLGYDTQVNIILPEDRDKSTFDYSKPFKFQVLYLLHGLGDDCNGWLRGTRIESYAQKHKIAVVMPSGEDSFYTDGLNGKKYFTYLTEELPTKIKRWFPISDKQEDTFIAGLSMGGYGAMKIGLSRPELFNGIAAFSGALDIKELPNNTPDDDDFKDFVLQRLTSVFGDLDNLESKHILLDLAKLNIEKGKKIPLIVQSVGTEDFLYDMNIKFENNAKALGLDIDYEEWEGVHDWDFWDVAIKKALNKFDLKNKVLV